MSAETPTVPSSGRRRLGPIDLAVFLLLLLMVALAVLSQLQTQRDYRAEQTERLAALIARESQGALRFTDPQLLTNRLQMLSFDPGIASVCLYDLRPGLLTYYHKTAAAACPERPEQNAGGWIRRPVQREAQLVGHLLLRQDSSALWHSLWPSILPIIGMGVMLFMLQLLMARREVTRRAQALEAKLAAEAGERNALELLRKTIGRLPFPVFALDAAGGFLFANRAMATLFDVDRQTLLTQGIAAAPDSTGAELVREAADLRGEERDVWLGDRTQDARNFLIKRIPETGNTPAFFVAVDLTEIHRLQLQLQYAQRLEVIGTLAGGIAHDFNNLLTPILGYSSILLGRDLPAEDLRKLKAIATAAEEARLVVQQLLTFSRQQQSSVPRKFIQLGEVVGDAMRLVRASVPSTIQIDYECAEQLEPILADRGQIHQIVVNLCTNAAHAMDNHRGHIQVSVRHLEELESGMPEGLMADAWICLDVRDNGQGMTPEVMEHIFEPFFTTKEEGKGTGLGLSVVHGIVQSHGGHIVADSRPGLGSRFRVLLPMRPTVEMPALSVTNTSSRAPRILLVDDDQQVLETLKLLLESQGHQVFAFTRPQQALAALERAPEFVDLLITDYRMPQLRGDQLTIAARKIRKNLSALLITGYADVDFDALSMFQGKLMKPIVGAELAAAIRASLPDRFRSIPRLDEQ